MRKLYILDGSTVIYNYLVKIAMIEVCNVILGYGMLLT